MISTIDLLKAALSRRKRRKRLRRILVETARSDTGAFVAACKALQVTAIERSYLDRYRIKLDLNGNSITQSVLSQGHFQIELFQHLAAVHHRRDLLFVNVGANIGTTCLNAHSIGFRELMAFEPVRSNADILTENLRQLAADSQVEIVRAAVGAEPGSVTINLNAKSSGRHSVVRDFGDGGETVDVVTLDALLPSRSGFLWIDTEGYELQVLKGGARYLDEFADGLCVEITPELIGKDGLREIIEMLSRPFNRFLTADGARWDGLDAITDLKNGEQCDVICLK